MTVHVARRGRIACGCLLAAVFALVLLPPQPSAALEPSAPSGIARIGRLDVSPPRQWEGRALAPISGSMILRPSSRRAYQVFSSYEDTFIRPFDLDGLAALPGVELRGAPYAFPGETVHGFTRDERFLLFLWGTSQRGGLSEKFTSIMVLDLAALEEGRDPARLIPVAVPPSLPAGMEVVRHAGRDKVLVFLEGLASLVEEASAVPMARHDHLLMQWDVRTGAQDWVHTPSSCTSAAVFPVRTKQNLRMGMLHLSRAVYLVCQAAKEVSQVVRVALAGDGTPSGVEEAFPGPLWAMDVHTDEQAERLLIRTQPNERGLAWWVFDARLEGYVGVIGLTAGSLSTAALGQGLDPATGRAYALLPPARDLNSDTIDPGGLLVADARRTPAVQALAFTRFADYGRTKIVIDPRAGSRPARLFVRTSDGLRGDAPWYDVYRDDIPVIKDPDVSLAGLTADVAERPGVTGRSFHGSGSAYGFRALLIGGVESLQGGQFGSHARSPCWSSDRAISIARIPTVALSDTVASAKAIASEADEASKVDMSKPVGRCQSNFVDQPAPGAVDETLGSEWPHEAAACAGDERMDRPSPSSGVEAYAHVACAHSDFSVEGEARTRSSDIAGVRVASSIARVESRVVPGRGVVVAASAEVRGVEIAGVGHIDLIRATAETFANGRKRGAGSNAWDAQADEVKLDRVICGVHLGSFVREPCGDVAPVQEALNRALGVRGRAFMYEPDASAARGAFSGYRAAIGKSLIQKVADVQFNADPSSEVSALRVVLYNDSGGRKREIYDFAGVSSASTYGIYLLPRIADDGPDAAVAPEIGEPQTRPARVSADVPDRAPSVVSRGFARRAASGLGLFLSVPDALAVMIWTLLGLPLYLAKRRVDRFDLLGAA